MLARFYSAGGRLHSPSAFLRISERWRQEKERVELASQSAATGPCGEADVQSETAKELSYVELGRMYEVATSRWIKAFLFPKLEWYQSHGQAGDEGVDLRGMTVVPALGQAESFPSKESLEAQRWLYVFVQCKNTKSKLGSSYIHELMAAIESRVTPSQSDESIQPSSIKFPYQGPLPLGIIVSAQPLTTLGKRALRACPFPMVSLQLQFTDEPLVLPTDDTSVCLKSAFSNAAFQSVLSHFPLIKSLDDRCILLSLSRDTAAT